MKVLSEKILGKTCKRKL